MRRRRRRATSAHRTTRRSRRAGHSRLPGRRVAGSGFAMCLTIYLTMLGRLAAQAGDAEVARENFEAIAGAGSNSPGCASTTPRRCAAKPTSPTTSTRSCAGWRTALVDRPQTGSPTLRVAHRPGPLRHPWAKPPPLSCSAAVNGFQPDASYPELDDARARLAASRAVSRAERRKVAILGGGMAGVTAAWRLSEPGWEREFESITIYQRGFRLGGKGRQQPRRARARSKSTGSTCGSATTTTRSGCCASATRSWTGRPPIPTAPIRTWRDAMLPAAEVGPGGSLRATTGATGSERSPPTTSTLAIRSARGRRAAEHRRPHPPRRSADPRLRPLSSDGRRRSDVLALTPSPVGAVAGRPAGGGDLPGDRGGAARRARATRGAPSRMRTGSSAHSTTRLAGDPRSAPGRGRRRTRRSAACGTGSFLAAAVARHPGRRGRSTSADGFRRANDEDFLDWSVRHGADPGGERVRLHPRAVRPRVRATTARSVPSSGSRPARPSPCT